MMMQAHWHCFSWSSFPRKRKSILRLGKITMDSRFRGNDDSKNAGWHTGATP